MCLLWTFGTVPPSRGSDHGLRSVVAVVPTAAACDTAGTGGREAPGPQSVTTSGRCAVSLIRRGDEEIHFSDNSHRWACPDPDGNQDAWTDRVRAHQEQHRLGA